jgi:PAS domain S-box-containing protein
MKAVIIGGGRGCRAIIELALGFFLQELPLDILCVADPDDNAEGMIFAGRHGIKTARDMKQALSLPDIELVIELTGRDEILEKIYDTIPRGIKVIEHTFAKVFVDLANARRNQEQQLREITELEKKIENDRLFLQSVFDKMPELVAVIDSEKRLIKVNTGFSRFTGFRPEDAEGKSCLDVFNHTELSSSCEQSSIILKDALESGDTKSFIWQSPRPYENVWEITHTPIPGKDGKTEEILSTWYRITEQAILQQKIDAAELRFKSFIDSAHDWISIKNLEGQYIIVNKIAAQSLHLKPEDFIGKKPDEVLPPGLAAMIIKHDKQVIKDDRYRSYTEIVPIDGRDIHFLANRFPLKDYRGRTFGICTIMRNITAEITLRAQLEQAGKLAAIGKLAASVAHEINNPLTGVLAFAEDLMTGFSEKSQQYEDLAVIVRETLRCRGIVKNLLDFSRQKDPDFQQLSPNKIVKQSLALIEKSPEFRNINIATKLDEDIPMIQGDPEQIQQVLLNFMFNAVEAMEGVGKIQITTSFDETKNCSIITVEDNGPGIPEDIKDRIFEPFFSTKGTNGLGLALSWGIIERHLGTIEVDSSESGGASFSIAFPTFDEGIEFCD